MNRTPDQTWPDFRYDRLVQYAGAQLNSELLEDTSDLAGTGLCFDTTERDLPRPPRED